MTRTGVDTRADFMDTVGPAAERFRCTRRRSQETGWRRPLRGSTACGSCLEQIKAKQLQTSTPFLLLLFAILLTSCHTSSWVVRNTAPEVPVRIQGQPSFQSEKPLYARVALTKDGSKVLNVVFDESEGTGTDYDLMYADVDRRGSFENALQAGARCIYQRRNMQALFPPIESNSQGEVMAGRDPDRRVFLFRYYRYGHNGGQQQFFQVENDIAMRQDATDWEYRLYDILEPSESLAQAPVWRFDRSLILEVDTRSERDGSLGIALSLRIGDSLESAIQGKKGGAPIAAVISITKPGGEVVHRDTDRLEKFVFG